MNDAPETVMTYMPIKRAKPHIYRHHGAWHVRHASGQVTRIDSDLSLAALVARQSSRLRPRCRTFTAPNALERSSAADPSAA